MKTLFVILVSVFFVRPSQPRIDQKEAKAAYEFLNQVRTRPDKFVKAMPFLKDIKAVPALKWNDTLARVAETKALDMAKRHYFAHVDPEGFGMNHYISKAGYTLKPDWLRKPTANYFESCNAGGLSGRQAIEMLLIDSGVVNHGHHKHLLGIDSWSATLYDIGIGFAHTDSGSYYKTYTCVLIAKHN